jgi:hypothetical protein
MKYSLSKVLAILCFALNAELVQAVTCTGTMRHVFGADGVRYEFSDIETSLPDGYVKYWGPGAGAWTEGVFNLRYDVDSKRQTMVMNFGTETNTCLSMNRINFSCASNRSPVRWDITCEEALGLM